MKKYFINITTLEALKKEYRKLAFKLHPDRNEGKDADFKIMVNEYDELFKKLQSTTTNKYEATENINNYKDIINELLKMDGIEIEIVGYYIYLSGNTYNNKEQIKALKFLWSSKHKKWYYNGDAKKSRSHSKLTYNDIKNKYGCTTLKSNTINCITI